MIIYRQLLDKVMALKVTSEPIQISFRVEQDAVDTFKEARVDLQLNPLDQEVMLVYAIDVAPSPPDNALAMCSTFAQVSTTSQTAISGLETPSVLCRAERSITFGSDAAGNVAVAFEHMAGETPQADLDYIGIISTNDFYVQIDSANCIGVKAVAGRMWCARARADAATYAALVNSEVLSS
tara:strand:+ start:742 stop:1284 length:543 start_codon:yes stop_codon:yes gene_type:complete